MDAFGDPSAGTVAAPLSRRPPGASVAGGWRSGGGGDDVNLFLELFGECDLL
jgi:hypothetical protein